MIRADFSLITNNKDASRLLMDKVASVEVILHSGFISDHCIVTVDDHPDARIQAPKAGDKIKIALGYQQNELIDQGEYEVAEHCFSGAQDALAIYANKFNWSKALKSPKHQSWPSTPEQPLLLKDLVEKIAADHGLQPKVNAQLGAIILPAIEQNESALELLTKLATQYDATATLVAEYLIFMRRGTGLSRSGEPLSQVDLSREQLIDWQVLISQQPLYQSCQAYYHDMVAAERKVVKVGSGSPCYELRYPLADETTAEWAATSRLNDFKRSQKTIRATTIGAANLMAGSPVKITNVRTDIDGVWFLTRVHHRIDADGYICIIEGEQLTA